MTRCRSTSTSAGSASRTSRSSSGTASSRTARSAPPRTCASSSRSSQRTAPPSSQATDHPVAVAAEAVAAAEQLTELEVLAREAAGCTRCRLHEGRTQVVFVGQAGKLLDKLLAGIGLERSQVYICNVLKCRPPGNRDPVPDEKEACEPYLFRQVDLIRPKVIATLGNHATKQLSGKETGITRVHGQEQRLKVGSREVLLYPLYHPAAALYTPAILPVPGQVFARLPELLGREVAPPIVAAPQLVEVPAEPAVQLGLF